MGARALEFQKLADGVWEGFFARGVFNLWPRAGQNARRVDTRCSEREAFRSLSRSKIRQFRESEHAIEVHYCSALLLRAIVARYCSALLWCATATRYCSVLLQRYCSVLL